MRVRLLPAVLLAAATVAGAATAQAQAYVKCTNTYGDSQTNAYAWTVATYELTPSSIRTWDPGKGWSANHALGNDGANGYSVTDDAYTLTYSGVFRGQYAYTNYDYTVTLQRRTGVVTVDYRSEQFGNDGRPNPYNTHPAVKHGRSATGVCEVTTSPEKAPPKF